MCLRSIHQVMKGEINGSVALIVILSIQVVFSLILPQSAAVSVFGTLLNTLSTCCDS